MPLGQVVDAFTTIKSTEGCVCADHVIDGNDWRIGAKGLKVTSTKEVSHAVYESITDRETGARFVRVTVPNFGRLPKRQNCINTNKYI